MFKKENKTFVNNTSGINTWGKQILVKVKKIIIFEQIQCELNEMFVFKCRNVNARIV